MKEVLTTFEAAKMLNLSPYTIRLWIIKGLLKGHKTAGGHRRINKSDLIRFLKQNNMPLPSFEKKKNLKFLVGSDNNYEFTRLKKLKDSFNLTTAKNPLDMGIKIEKIKPHIILLDFDSKAFSSKDLAASISQNCEIAEAVLIGFAKKVTAKVVSEAQKEGYYDVLLKPLSEEELKKVLSKIFEKKKNPYRLKRSK